MFLLSVLKTDSVLIISVYYTLTLCLNIHQGRRHSVVLSRLKRSFKPDKNKSFSYRLKTCLTKSQPSVADFLN
jgi:hypothetical protein